MYMRSFLKIIPSRNGNMTLPFTDGGNSCSSREIFCIANMSFNTIHENKVLAKISEFTVLTVIFSMIPGRVAQSVTCLATDVSLIADPGVASSIPARSHTFVAMDHSPPFH